MQKKKITAFLLALAMVSAMALPVFAQETNPRLKPLQALQWWKLLPRKPQPPRNRKLTLNRQRTT